jgi:hypothetical protein
VTAALSGRSGLSRLSVAGTESPILSVARRCGVLHPFGVLSRLVSPARPLLTEVADYEPVQLSPGVV